MVFLHRIGLGSAMVSAMALLAPPVHAAEAKVEASPDDIIVTARKREELARDIPIAITAMTAQFLEDSRVNRIEDVFQFIPNVSFDDMQADSFTGSISIRGVVRNTDVEEPGYGLYKDGVYIGSSVVGLDQFNDLERIEVLKGPQGGLYGRNAIGGAINIVSKKPADRLEGMAELTVANFNSQEYRGMINVPLDDTLAVRLNVYHIGQKDGKAKSAITGAELDKVDATGARAAILYKPSDRLTINATLEYQHSFNPAAILINGPRLGNSVPPGTDEGALIISGKHRVIKDTWQATTQADLDVDIGTLTTLVSYRNLKVDSQTGYAPFVGAGGATRQGNEQNWFVETRLTSPGGDSAFDYLVGVNYLNEDRDSYRVLNLPVGVVPGGFVPGQGPTFLDLGTQSPMTTISTKLMSWAAFGELTYHVTPQIDITASGRFTHERKKYTNFVETPSAAPFRGTGADIGVPQIGFPGFHFNQAPWTVDYKTTNSWTNFSPTISISYKPVEAWMMYAKVATGFKAGGYNNEASSVDLLPFDQEKAVSYELGAKGTAWDNRIHINLAVFRVERKNAAIFVTDDNSIFQLLGVAIVGNGGRTTTNGAEADVTIRPLKGLSLYAAAGYLDAKFHAGYVDRFGNDYSGNQVPQTAKWSVSTVATYRFPIRDGLTVFNQASYSNRWGGYELDNNLLKLDHQELINLNLGLEAGRFRVTGYVNNLLNDRNKLRQRGNATGLTQFIRGTARTYGVDIKYSF